MIDSEPLPHVYRSSLPLNLKLDSSLGSADPVGPCVVISVLLLLGAHFRSNFRSECVVLPSQGISRPGLPPNRL